MVPGAAAVLVGRRLHVVETYTNAAIDWGPKSGGGWEGQYLYASRLGSPAGHVGAAAGGRALWSAWTELTSESISVLLTISAGTQDTATVVDHGIFVSLFLAAGRPEIGAYDWVELDNSFVYAGVLADTAGPFGELDGRLEDYARAPGGRRQVLLSTGSGLEWFETPGRPALYATTRQFLDDLGLRSLQELPPLEEIAQTVQPEPAPVAEVAVSEPEEERATGTTG